VERVGAVSQDHDVDDGLGKPGGVRPSAVVRDRSDFIREVAHRHHGVDVHVFGSVAKGDDIPGSDLDLLITFDRSASYYDIVELERELSEALGLRVEVISRGTASDEIVATAVPL
jgi:predicted nucleotidyltransferase